MGVEGLSVSRVATLDKVKLCGVELEKVPVEVPASWNRTIPAIVGFELLNRFHIVTDYPKSQIWLSPYPSRIALPIPKDRSGIGAIPTPSGLKVLHVAEASPAEASGLKAGDQIVKIDGERVDSAYIISHPRMGARPAGTQSELTLSDGRIVHLTLADYY
jgi:membrane-associated protease RseP (regulator of RpoE activity)